MLLTKITYSKTDYPPNNRHNGHNGSPCCKATTHPEGFYCVKYQSLIDTWCGRVKCIAAARRVLLPREFKGQRELSTGTYGTAAEAARAVDRWAGLCPHQGVDHSSRSARGKLSTGV
jgi:hypothetical protein